METVEEIIEHLEFKLAEAHELHDQATDKQERLFYFVSITFISQLLDEIKHH